mgnify:CR=1 FL=1
MALQIVVRETAFGKSVPPAAPEEAARRLAATRDPLIHIATRCATEHRHVAAGAEFAAFVESGRYLFVVLDGWLCRETILEDGRRQVLDFLLPGDLIVGARQTDSSMPQSIEAITDATIAVIPLSAVNDLATKQPSLALTLLEASQRALLTAYENLVDTGRRTSLEAVADFILRMESRAAAAIGRTRDGSVPFPLIQEHIGDAIGLTAVHVCRTLRKLKAAGAIETGRGWLKITDRAHLGAIAGICLPDDEDEIAPRQLAS